MKCDKVRELLLTDYRDRELDGRGREAVEAHLKECPDCKRFWEEAESLSLPWCSREICPGEEVWQAVREQTFGKKSEIGWPRGFSGLWDVFRRPAPVLRFALVMVLIAVAVPLVKLSMPAPVDEQVVSEYLTDQMDLLSDLENGNLDVLTGDGLEKEFDYFDFG